MTIRDTTAPAQTEAVAFDALLPHPPAMVWRALTDPALLAEWLLPVAGFTLEPGARFEFTAPPQAGWDGIVYCRIIEIDEPVKLTYNWVVGDMDTIVTFTLTPAAAGTRLVIVQSGFKPDQKRNFGGARYGWKMMTGKLVDLLGRM